MNIYFFTFLLETMTSYFTAKYDDSKTATRTPLKVIQVVAGNEEDMSASRKCGLIHHTHVPRQSRFSKPVEAKNKSSTGTESLNASNPSSSLPKSKACDRIPALSKVSRKGSPSPDSRQNESTTSNAKVHSLMSSPKWSRIKDKFESSAEESEKKNSSPHNGSLSSKYHINSRPSTLSVHSRQDCPNVGKCSKPTLNHPKPTPENKNSIRGKISTKQEDKLTSNKNTTKRPENVRERLNISSSRSQNITSSSAVKNDTLGAVKTANSVPKCSCSGLKDVCIKATLNSAKVCNNCSKPSSSLPVQPNGSNKLNLSRSFRDFSAQKSELYKNIQNDPSSRSGKEVSTSNSTTNDKSLGSQKSNFEYRCPPLRHSPVQSRGGDQHEGQNALNRTIKNKVLNVTNSQSGNKSIWVKDEIGNWTKNFNDKKTVDEQKQQPSKVAILRTKFNSELHTNGSSHGVDLLAKSKTTSSVPQTVQSNTCRLMKSNTTGDVLNSSHAHENFHRGQVCDIKIKGPLAVSTNSISTSESSERTSPSSDEKSPDQVRKLSLVQRAVLSYEENLSLLSPETQRKLKLLGEKVKAQNHEDSLMETSSKHIYSLNVDDNVEWKDSHRKTNVKQNLDVAKFGEPILPVRNFLSRYHNLQNKKKDGKPVDKLCGENTTVAVDPVKSISSAVPAVNNPSDSKISVKALAKHFVSKNSSSAVPKEALNKTVTSLPASARTLRPNASFLWRDSKSGTTQGEQKGSEEDNESYHNYYVLENYYADAENTKLVEGGHEGTGVNPPIKLTAGEACYQNIEHNETKRDKSEIDDGWIDLSDEDLNTKSTSSSRSSTLKRKRNKRHSHYKEILQRNCTQSLRGDTENGSSNDRVPQLQDSKNQENDLDKNEYADAQNCQYSDHLYESVYESLGNFLTSDDNNENEVPSLSPDDEQKDIYSSFTSLESLHSDKGSNEPRNKGVSDNDVARNSVGIGKKATSKIRQLRRHLSWTKSDIKLELSSKFNKIKIKKNGHNRTEIGVRVQENGNTCTSPKKNTFIKCILKQKSCNSEPVKKSPSPKKESALFYVHLSMTREKQRPFSDSSVENISQKTVPAKEPRKTSEPILASTQLPPGRLRKRSSCQVIQRPKTPPPLPPTKVVPKPESVCDQDSSMTSTDTIQKENSLYSEYKRKDTLDSNNHKPGPIILKDEDIYSDQREVDSNSPSTLYATIDSITSRRKRNSITSSTSYESYALADESGSSGASSSTTYSSGFTLQIESDMAPFCSRNSNSLTSNLSLPLIKDFKNDFLKSPFEEEPLYQFYHKDVQQRASMWCTADGSESEFDEYAVHKEVSNESPVRPQLQSQTSAMDLLRGEGGQRSLWCEVPDVRDSGILETISSQDRKIQEAMFEVITSEASYLKSMNFLLEHFVQYPEFRGQSQENRILDKRELHILFSDVPPVRDVSASFLADLEKRWLESIVLSNVCDVIYRHASKHFSVYVKYCSNQLYQDRMLKQLKENRPQFVEVLKKLESSPVCQGLDMQSFLMLPMQRITRLPLLVDAIFHRLDVDSPIYESCKLALVLLNKLVAECNEGARKMERMEEMLVISHQLDFRDCKGLGVLSASRWLVKKGELVQLVLDNSTKRAFGRNQRWCKIRLFLFLFTDLFVITRKKSDDTYCVVDYCPRNMVQVMLLNESTAHLPCRLPTNYQNVFQLIMLNNSEGKTVEMMLSCVLESDRTRWIDAVTPPKSENPEEKIYEAWDCPQVQCTHPYTAQQSDELTIEETDVVNVFRKVSDGWFQGERIRDGVKGWFPSSHTIEIVSSHVRARNLRQRYRLLQLSQTYLEEQQKVQAAQTRKG